MKLSQLPIDGAYLIVPEPISDERGFFARTFERELFAELGLVTDFYQHSVAFNQNCFTLRGLHFQHAPYSETKLVRCVHGEIHDVIVDLRPDSISYLKWYAVTLDSLALNTLYIPAGCAHGYLTMEENSLVEYLMDAPYMPDAACGIRYDDSFFDVYWPANPSVISKRDSNYADFHPEKLLII